MVINEKRISDCINFSNLRSFVNQLPMKEKSIVGELDQNYHGQK